MFAAILQDLVHATPGAFAALFLDYEGETVALHGERPFELSDDDLKIIGAYQGIFLSQLRDLCTRTETGAPRRFKVEFTRKRILSTDLADGYYLVILLDRVANEALAWRQLERCRERLLAEM